MIIVNVKTPIIELFFYHRGTEDTEKIREGGFYLDKRLCKYKNKYKANESSEEN